MKGMGPLLVESFNLQYEGQHPERDVPPWMTAKYEVYFWNPSEVFRDQMANADFDSEIDYAPLREFVDGQRRLKNFMSGDWAWKTSRKFDLIAQDPNTHGAAFVPVILGSDKITVSVATGQTEYYLLYGSIGGVHNNVRRAHRNAVTLLGFLAIPKTDKEFSEDAMFRKFHRQLFHSSLSRILQPLKPGMTTPEIMLCADGHYRHVVYGLGPYIADYPEQVLLACIVSGWYNLDGPGYGWRCREHTELLVEELELGVLWDEYGLVGDIVPFTNDFPRADIHELLSPDLLHQIIKGTFKDHLVSWVEEYIELMHSKREGHGFKQWTGDDSKALMKVYLPAIAEYVPEDMVWAIQAFLDFCYIARRNVHTEQTLDALQDALDRFHYYRKIFETCGVRPDGISLPQQHSLCHYRFSIWEFASPNGLCSSITESKHIKAALGQMLRTNQRIDKLAAAHVDFTKHGMLKGSWLSNAFCKICKSSFYTTEDINIGADCHVSKPLGPDEQQDDDGSVPGPTVLVYIDLAATVQQRHPRGFAELAHQINQPELPELIRRFLYDQLNPNNPRSASDALSDPCGIGGMHREHLRANPVWCRHTPRFDCALVNRDPNLAGMLSIDVVRIRLLFSFKHAGHQYPCALIHWFQCVCDQPDDTGMWIVRPETDEQGASVISMIHVDSIIRAAHLISVYGDGRVSRDITDKNSLDAFRAFYVNKFADHHAFEILS
ncbi:hypothetical protein BKA93DRAFT_820601 [Sparassis latifolia]